MGTDAGADGRSPAVSATVPSSGRSTVVKLLPGRAALR